VDPQGFLQRLPSLGASYSPFGPSAAWPNPSSRKNCLGSQVGSHISLFIGSGFYNSGSNLLRIRAPQDALSLSRLGEVLRGPKTARVQPKSRGVGRSLSFRVGDRVTDPRVPSNSRSWNLPSRRHRLSTDPDRAELYRKRCSHGNHLAHSPLQIDKGLPRYHKVRWCYSWTKSALSRSKARTYPWFRGSTKHLILRALPCLLERDSSFLLSERLIRPACGSLINPLLEACNPLKIAREGYGGDEAGQVPGVSFIKAVILPSPAIWQSGNQCSSQPSSIQDSAANPSTGPVWWRIQAPGI
jgi:hypothetical protein